MKFRPGDKVKFKDEPERGVVVRMDRNGWVIVRTPDGFERPVDPDDLMITGLEDAAKLFAREEEPVTPETEKSGEKEPETPEETGETTIPAGQEDPQVFLGVIQKNEKFAFYLINDSDYFLNFTFGKLAGKNSARLLEKGHLEENTKLLLAELLPGAETILFIQCLLHGNPFFVPRPPCDKQIPFGINSIPRAREFRENPYFEEKAWLIPLLKQTARPETLFVDKRKKKEILREKGDLPGRKMMLRPEIAGNEPVEEVDLHAESFMEDVTGMSNGEILEAQLARFEIVLEGAIRNKQKKIVFIHGLGNGKLKHEIRKRLEKRKIRYQDASFKEYGYGATLVILNK